MRNRRYGAADLQVQARLLRLLRDLAWRTSQRRAQIRDHQIQLRRSRRTVSSQDFDEVERDHLECLAVAVDARALAGRWRNGSRPVCGLVGPQPVSDDSLLRGAQFSTRCIPSSIRPAGTPAYRALPIARVRLDGSSSPWCPPTGRCPATEAAATSFPSTPVCGGRSDGHRGVRIVPSHMVAIRQKRSAQRRPPSLMSESLATMAASSTEQGTGRLTKLSM